MDIALLGGTGDIGQGLALRWAADSNHTVIIGSREAEKADQMAEEYETELDSRGRDVTVEGLSNLDATARADVVVAAVPAYHLTDTVESVADELGDAVLVSPAVGMKRDEDGFHYNQPGVGSVTELAANAAPDDTPVVGAFHNLAAGRLANLDAEPTGTPSSSATTATRKTRSANSQRPSRASGPSTAAPSRTPQRWRRSRRCSSTSPATTNGCTTWA